MARAERQQHEPTPAFLALGPGSEGGLRPKPPPLRAPSFGARGHRPRRPHGR